MGAKIQKKINYTAAVQDTFCNRRKKKIYQKN